MSSEPTFLIETVKDADGVEHTVYGVDKEEFEAAKKAISEMKKEPSIDINVPEKKAKK